MFNSCSEMFFISVPHITKPMKINKICFNISVIMIEPWRHFIFDSAMISLQLPFNKSVEENTFKWNVSNSNGR